MAASSTRCRRDRLRQRVRSICSLRLEVGVEVRGQHGRHRVVERDEHDLLVVVERAAVEVGRADRAATAVHGHDLGVHHRGLEVPDPHAAADQLVVRGLAGELAGPLVGVRAGQQDVDLDARAAPPRRAARGRTSSGAKYAVASAQPLLAESSSTRNVVCRSSQPSEAEPRTTCATVAPACGCCGNGRCRRRARGRSRPSSARTPRAGRRRPARAPRRGCPATRRASRASPHHSSAMPTPPVNAISSSTTSTLRWQRWFCFSGEFSHGLRNHSTCTPASSMRSTRPFSICRPPTASMSSRTRTPRAGRRRQRLGEPRGDVALPVDVRHQVDAVRGRVDGGEHRREDLVAVAQHA